MRIISLASSSRHGNAYLISEGHSSILVDCGLAIRKLEVSLRELQIAPQEINGVFISHEHVDHIKALQLRNPFPAKYGIKVFAPHLFWQAARSVEYIGEDLRYNCRVQEDIRLGDFTILPFSKPHDSNVSVGYKVIGKEGRSVVVATDLGEVTPAVISAAQDADYIIIESNHDVQMERLSGRPYSLVARVLGNRGHLSNEQAGQALRLMVTTRTRGVMLAHLSLECNTPMLALQTAASHLRRSRFSGFLTVAQPEGVTVLSDIGVQEQESLF